MSDEASDRPANDNRGEAFRAAAQDALVRAQELAVMQLQLRERTRSMQCESDGLLDTSRRLRRKLRESVAEHARLLKRVGDSQEQVIATIEAVASDIARRARHGRTALSEIVALEAEMRTWSKEAYDCASKCAG